jgi:hypothetical protein
MPRAKQTEIPMKGKGVEVCTDKKLLELSNERTDVVDTENTSKTRRKAIDEEIINRMHIIRLKVFRTDTKLYRINVRESVKVVKVKDKQIASLDEADAEGA